MKKSEREKLTKELQAKPNTPLVVTVLFTVIFGVISSFLIGKEASTTGKVEEFYMYVFFGMFLLTGGIVTFWYQIRRIDKQIQAILQFLPIEVKDDEPVIYTDAAIDDTKAKDEDDEEEDDDEYEDDDDDEYDDEDEEDDDEDEEEDDDEYEDDDDDDEKLDDEEDDEDEDDEEDEKDEKSSKKK